MDHHYTLHPLHGRRRCVPHNHHHNTHCSTNVIIIIIIIGSSIVLLVETARPGAGFGNPLISKFGTAFWSISVSLNVISTILIAGMLLYHDRKLRRLGFQGNGPYTGIAAVLAESAALYSICGLIYIPLFARNMDLQYPFSPLFISAAVSQKKSLSSSYVWLESD